MFNTILVPLDGTAESNAALPAARTLARATGASIWLLRVAPESLVRDSHSATHDAGQSLDAMASEFGSSELHVQAVVREGDPAAEILRLSNEIRADLIIMRTHGRAGLERAVFGSVAEEVVKKTTIPTLLVRPGERRLDSVRRLLLPVDGSHRDDVAVAVGSDLARATGAAMTILQVAVPIPMLAYAAPFDVAGAPYYDTEWDDSAVRAANTYVGNIATQLRGLGLSVDAEVRTETSAAEGILTTADRIEADVIVMSTRALTGAARAFLGSVADAVVRTAPSPVLVVRQR